MGYNTQANGLGFEEIGPINYDFYSGFTGYYLDDIYGVFRLVGDVVEEWLSYRDNYPESNSFTISNDVDSDIFSGLNIFDVNFITGFTEVRVLFDNPDFPYTYLNGSVITIKELVQKPAFVFGTNSIVNGGNSIVLGANIIGYSSNTTYVDRLNIKTLGDGTSVNSLGIDENGNVVSGSIGSVNNHYVTGWEIEKENGNTISLGYGKGKITLTNGSNEIIGIDGVDFTNEDNFDSPFYSFEMTIILPDGTRRYIELDEATDSTHGILSTIYSDNQYINELSSVWGDDSGDYEYFPYFISEASGEIAFSEGYSTQANGQNSHAEGNNTQANGQISHAEGYLSQANGPYSHAEGYNTAAIGQSSHAEGLQAQANGESSHAEGIYTQANGYASHAEGNSTTASGDYSHAEGWSSQANGVGSHAEGGNNDHSGGIANGESSHAEGQGTISEGTASHTEGSHTQAIGYASHAEGQETYARGNSSHAEGSNTQANGVVSHAEGLLTIAGGNYSHAEGQESQANGYCSHAEGASAQANGDTSHAEGALTIASGTWSHAEGNNSIASGSTSHAEGSNTQANGFVSHAEGRLSIAQGDYSHAGGVGTTANGVASFVHGSGSTVSGNYSIVLGRNITGSTADTTYVDNFNAKGDLLAKTISFRNVANTFTSTFTNANTASRTYTLPDNNGTVAMTSDLFSGYQALSAITKTFTLTDAGGFIHNTLPNNNVVYTIPTNAVVPFPLGTKINVSTVFCNIGAFTISGPSVTILSPTALTVRYASWFILTKIATDTWIVQADVSSFSSTSGNNVITQGNLQAGAFIGNIITSSIANPSGSVQLTNNTSGFILTGSDQGVRTNFIGLNDINSFTTSASTNPFTSFGASPTINQTGSANGITSGFYYNPNLVSAFDNRALNLQKGSIVFPYAAKSATYSISNNDYLLDFTGGTFTATLPTAVGCTGKIYVLKNSGGGSITIATTSSQTIDGETSYMLSTQYSTITVVSNGINWIITDKISTINQIEVSGNTTAQLSWWGKEVTFMTSGTLTIPASLPDQYSFDLAADAGVTIAWAITAPHTWRVAGLSVGTVPPSVLDGQFCTVSKRIGTNEIRVRGL